jgi:hypothetical protein
VLLDVVAVLRIEVVILDDIPGHRTVLRIGSVGMEIDPVGDQTVVTTRQGIFEFAQR